MPPIGGGILQQGGGISHLLDVTGIRKIIKILDFGSPSRDVVFCPPAKYGRVFWLHLHGESLTRSLLLVGASIGRKWRGWCSTSIWATTTSSSTMAGLQCDSSEPTGTVHSTSSSFQLVEVAPVVQMYVPDAQMGTGKFHESGMCLPAPNRHV